jgi:threonine dehydratase
MIELEDVKKARERIQPYVRRTPLERNSTLSARLGTNVYLKYELFQKTGSFKPRGAFNQMLPLTPEQRARGVVAVSGGNFAQGVAYAGQVLGIPTLILMPSFTPQNYLDATKAYGALIELTPTIAEAFERSRVYQEQGLAYLHPYDSDLQMAGCGTIGLELLEDLPDLTDVFFSIGGGGLLGGNIVALKALRPQVRIYGVETEGADAMGQALEAGRIVHIQPTSLAKTLGAPYVSANALALAQAHLAGYLRVSDREAFQAQIYLLERAKVNTELATSCTLAAADRVKDRFSRNDHVVLLLCGGNTSLENLIAYHSQLA